MWRSLIRLVTWREFLHWSTISLWCHTSKLRIFKISVVFIPSHTHVYTRAHTHTYLLSTQCTSFPHFLSCDQYWGRTMCSCSQLCTRCTHFLLLHTSSHIATCTNTCDLVQYKADHLTSLPLLLHLQCLGGDIHGCTPHVLPSSTPCVSLCAGSLWNPVT